VRLWDYFTIRPKKGNRTGPREGGRWKPEVRFFNSYSLLEIAITGFMTGRRREHSEMAGFGPQWVCVGQKFSKKE
jgi:hypothetical protein